MFEQGIPASCSTRIEGDTYTTFIGADNREIGKAAGKYIVELLGGKGSVVEIKGLPGSPPARDRSEGFREAIAGSPEIRITHDPVANWLREEAMAQMESALAAHEKIDLVYAHNDPMAAGAWLAARAKSRDGEMKFVGIDGLPGLEGDGRWWRTQARRDVVYPDGGRERWRSPQDLQGLEGPHTIVLRPDDHAGDREGAHGRSRVRRERR